MKQNIFLSYCHEDVEYHDKFKELFNDKYNINDADISLKEDTDTKYIDYLIENSCITNKTIVIALIGSKSYKRKHVDWEIYAALKQKAPLMGLTLPGRNDYRLTNFITQTIPHRLTDNVTSGYATLNKWTADSNKISNIISNATNKSKEVSLINNRRKLLSKDYHFCGAAGCECH